MMATLPTLHSPTITPAIPKRAFLIEFTLTPQKKHPPMKNTTLQTNTPIQNLTDDSRTNRLASVTQGEAQALV